MNMKKLWITMLLSAVAIIFLTGCATVGGISGGTYGVLFTQTDNAVAVGSAGKAEKIGTADSEAIIFFATGDSSISKAMANGKITKIHHIDAKVFTVLGVYAKYTTLVYGE
jgi:hypothetical protein